MGQKVNPVGFRLLLNHNWDSVWYDDVNYAENLIRDINIRKKLTKEYAYCGLSKILIERAGNKTTLTIKTAKPGVLIGKKGADIDKIKKIVEQMGEKDVSIKIAEVDKPDIDAKVVAYNIAKQLENRAAFRRVVKKAIQNAMRFGINGIKIMCSGRLGGAEIARSEQYKEGSIPLHTLKSNIDYATDTAHTTYGTIGIKVWIYKK